MGLRKNERGFSTVELVVTIAVLGVLVGLISASVIVYVDKAKEAKALMEAKAIYSTAQYAIVNASVDEKDAFEYALKYEENINGQTVRLGRFSNQSLYKYLQENEGSESLSSAKSKKADYYIAAELANSIPGANGQIDESTLKNSSPIGDSHSTAYIAQNPGTYGKVVFAMAYNEDCEIVYFQCVYNGYFIHTEGRELVSEKVSESTKFNDWPRTRAAGASGW